MGFTDLFKRRTPQAEMLKPVPKKSFFATIANQLYGSTDNYQGVAQEGYAKNPYIFSCVDQRAANLAALPVEVVSGERVIENAPIISLFKNAIYNNENISLYDFFYFTSCFLDLAGEVYFWGDSKDNPTEIILLNPADVEIKNINNKVQYMIGKKTVNQESEFFLCIKSFNPNDRYRGLAPSSAAALSLDTNNAGRKYNASLMQKHTKVSAILKGNAGEIPAEMRDQFRNEFKARVGGPTNAGDVLFMSGDIDYIEGQMKPVDMDWLNAMDLSGKEIAMAFKVPLELLGIGKATYENVKEAKLGFMQQVVVPQMQRILIAFEKALLNENEKLVINLDEVEVIQKFRQEAKRQEYTAKAEFSTSLYQSGIITQNEAREALGLDSLAGGDIVLPSLPIVSDVKSMKTITSFAEMRRITERARERESLKLSKKLATEFRKQEKEVLKALDDSRGDLGLFKTLIANSALDRIERLTDLLIDGKLGIIQRVGLEQLKELKKAFPSMNTKQLDEFDIYTEAVSNWVYTQTAKDVTGIDQTTENQIANAVQEGIDLGQGVDEIADSIQQAFKQNITSVRAMVIARTETAPAMNFGIVEAGKQAGVPLQKVWLAYGDSRTRESHRLMNGKAIDMDDVFKIGVNKLAFPADRSFNAAPSETIQCRCTIGYKEI